MDVQTPQRILILGSGGAGKSTLARRLGKALELPVFHLDVLSWKPGWVESSAEEFEAKLAEVVAQERWIIDGNYSRTLPQRLERADCAILLDLPVLLCITGVLSRVARNYGRVRPHMAPGCPERFDFGFLLWVWNYPRRSRAKALALLEGARERGMQVHVLKSRRAGEMLVEQLRGEGNLNDEG